MLSITEQVPETNYQRLQNFISDSRWSAEAVMDRNAIDVNEQIGDKEDAALLIDESGMPKKGTESVGVARQWLGRLGKIDNGQVAVFTALCRGTDVSLVNGRLYLPKEWTDDPERCRKAKVPEDYLLFKTKDEIAYEQVLHAKELGLEFGWVGADAGYGKGPYLMFELHKQNIDFVIDVPSDFTLYTRDVRPYIPEPVEGNRGRKPTRYVSDETGITVSKYAAQQDQSKWKIVKIRKTTKGVLKSEIFVSTIWVWDTNTQHYHKLKLIVRRDPGTKKEIKYSITNSDKTTERLAYMQAQRYWVERAFNDAKSQCGMADYELRGWTGFHHHLALCMMAQAFLMSERIANRKQMPLLSCRDVMEMFSIYLPQRIVNENELMNDIINRHCIYQRGIESAFRNQLK
jgi:SRSO17 transposase